MADYQNPTEVSCDVECPACGKRTWAIFDALVGSGRVPRTDVTCMVCNAPLTIEADLDVSVEVRNG